MLHAVESAPSSPPQFSRSMDTFLSVQSANALGLVSLADRKANMMLSANSIVLSIIFAVVMRRTPGQPLYLLVPSGILSVVCLIATVFAILAARPKVIKPSSKVDAHQLMSRLIFTQITYEDFRAGMNALTSDDRKVYESMLESLYANGQVIQRKFKYLSLSYAVFIYGLTLAVASYVLTLIA